MTFHAVFHKRNSLFLHLEVPKHQVFFEAGMASPTWLSLSAIGTEHAIDAYQDNYHHKGYIGWGPTWGSLQLFLTTLPSWKMSRRQKLQSPLMYSGPGSVRGTIDVTFPRFSNLLLWKFWHVSGGWHSLRQLSVKHSTWQLIYSWISRAHLHDLQALWRIFFLAF